MGISSEIGRLERVLVHRPGPELSRLTPDNKEALLFDDLLWLQRAQEEHDDFVAILREHGVEVLYFAELLIDAVRDRDVRFELVSRIFTAAQCGPRVSERLGARLADASPEETVEVLTAGLLESELSRWGIDPLFADVVADRFHYVLRPLPNLIFMRDNAAWIADGLALGVLATPARARESAYMDTIYRYHPEFRDAQFPRWYGAEPGDVYPASIEGGDVLVLDQSTVMVGLGERTAPAAVEILARRLFAGSAVQRLIAVHLEHARTFMHLDTAFTMVDTVKFNVFPGLIDEMRVHLIRPGSNGTLEVEQVEDLAATLGDLLGEAPRFVPTGGDAIGRLREQWDDGNNTLALEPGVVVAYGRNQETNRRLRNAGVEVLELDSSELCRGRGGSRCLTQPLLRAPVGST